jgi:hypothetical protein
MLNKKRVDAMIVVGKNGKSYIEGKRIYRHLQEVHKKNPKRMVNSPFIEIDNVTDVLKECPDRLATSMQYFLQGIGLLSAMPMRKTTPNPTKLNNARKNNAQQQQSPISQLQLLQNSKSPSVSSVQTVNKHLVSRNLLRLESESDQSVNSVNLF